MGILNMIKDKVKGFKDGFEKEAEIKKLQQEAYFEQKKINAAEEGTKMADIDMKLKLKDHEKAKVQGKSTSGWDFAGGMKRMGDQLSGVKKKEDNLK